MGSINSLIIFKTIGLYIHVLNLFVMNDNIFNDQNLRFDTTLFFKLMFENSKEASIFIMNEDGKILDINVGVHKTYGYLKEDLIGNFFSMLFTPEDREMRKPEVELATVIAKGSNLERNYLLHKNGSRIWSKEETLFTKNEAGEIFIVKVAYDINEQKLLENYLVSANEFFEGIIETINHPFIVLDNQFRIVKANKLFYQIFCFQKQSLPDSPVFEVCDGLFSSDELRLLLKEILPKNTSIQDFEIEYNSPLYGKRIFNLDAMQFVQGGEKQQKIMIALSDVTSQADAKIKLKEEKNDLHKMNKNLDTFVYSASHDLKAPINNIEGLVDHLENSIDCDDDCQELISMIKTSINKFKTILEDLSAIGRVQEEAKENIGFIEFKEMLEEVKFNLQETIEASHARIIDNFSKAPSIKISRNNLRSVLHNLVSNAIKYRSPDRIPEIRVSTSRANKKYILLKVSDNGLGIKEEDKDKVFSMYKRLNKNVEGTGVGMAIVSRIIDNSGGKIEVESEVGKGSTFKVYFKA
jgi:PAS domain S-box-containing protein